MVKYGAAGSVLVGTVTAVMAWGREVWHGEVRSVLVRRLW